MKIGQTRTVKEKGHFLSLILRFGQIVKICFRYFGPSLSTPHPPASASN